MSFWSAVLCGVLGGTLWSWMKRRRVGPQPESSTKDAVSFVCISMQTGDDACAAARRLKGRWFLAHAAPLLPLEGCDAVDCLCKYVTVVNRRQAERRQSHALQRGINSGQSNRENRRGGDRRRSLRFASDALR